MKENIVPIILHLFCALFVHYLSADITPVIYTGLFVEQSPCIDSTHKIRPFQVRPPPFFCHHPQMF